MWLNSIHNQYQLYFRNPNHSRHPHWQQADDSPAAGLGEPSQYPHCPASNSGPAPRAALGYASVHANWRRPWTDGIQSWVWGWEREKEPSGDWWERSQRQGQAEKESAGTNRAPVNGSGMSLKSKITQTNTTHKNLHDNDLRILWRRK